MAGASALTADQEQAADEDRTKRLFIGFLTSALGVDQTYIGADGQPASQTGQYTILNPDGSYSVQGQSVSNQNTVAGALGLSPGLLLLIGLAFFLLKR